MRVKRSTKAGQRGSVMLEFALSSSLMFLLFFGVVNFARLFTVAEVAQDSACAGTQYGALQPANYGDFTGMQNAAYNDAGNPSGMTATASQFCTCDIGGSHVDCTSSCNGSTLMKYLEVDVTVPLNLAMTYPGMPAITSLSRSSIVRVQ
jgi:Flp pilus assembly protein TadG